MDILATATTWVIVIVAIYWMIFSPGESDSDREIRERKKRKDDDDYWGEEERRSNERR